MITVVCTSCGRKLEFQADKAGQAQTCPHCQQALLVPAANPFAEANQEVSISQVIKALPGSPSNPFRGMDRQATLAALDETLKPYRLLGILGAAVMAVGTFLPIRRLPDETTNLNSFQCGELGTILLAFAVMALALTLSRSNQVLRAIALGSLTVILANFFQYLTPLPQQFSGTIAPSTAALEIRWGWSVLVVGALLLLLATGLGEKPPVKKPR